MLMQSPQCLVLIMKGVNMPRAMREVHVGDLKPQGNGLVIRINLTCHPTDVLLVKGVTLAGITTLAQHVMSPV
jgi:hypothetical protein